MPLIPFISKKSDLLHVAPPVAAQRWHSRGWWCHSLLFELNQHKFALFTRSVNHGEDVVFCCALRNSFESSPCVWPPSPKMQRSFLRQPYEIQIRQPEIRIYLVSANHQLFGKYGYEGASCSGWTGLFNLYPIKTTFPKTRKFNHYNQMKPKYLLKQTKKALWARKFILKLFLVDKLLFTWF